MQIDFFGLSFAAGDAVRYQYKFEGAGGEWSAPTEQRTVTANLSPGKYRFLVRAVGPDGAGVGSPASVSLNILPPVWQRWWFLALAALVAGSVIYRVARARARRALLLERVRTRIATDLHDDIGASLSKIAILSEVVSHRVNADANGAGSPVAEPLATIAGTSREMVDSMSDIVWAINPKRDRLSDLAQRMRLFASDLLSARDIQFTFRAPDAARDITVGADLRREVYLIFKETVNNLAKHSACEDAEIELRLAGSRLVVRVSDNGKGFDHDAQRRRRRRALDDGRPRPQQHARSRRKTRRHLRNRLGARARHDRHARSARQDQAAAARAAASEKVMAQVESYYVHR